MKQKPPYPDSCPKGFRRPVYRLAFCAWAMGMVVLVAVLTRCSVKEKTPRTPAKIAYGMEVPRVDNPEFLVVCEPGRYTLLYDTLYRQAAWAAYTLTRQDVENTPAERGDRFVICPIVREKGWPYATTKDYTNSGYDRGHLVPSADRLQTQAGNDATFRMSNIAPQTPRLNRVVWNALEGEVRELAERLDTLWIVTGGHLQAGLPRIGVNGVGVPERFFKVLLAKKDVGYQAIGFVIPNTEEIAGTFRDYAVSVEAVEELAGIDFFPNLPDAIEERVEATYDPTEWEF
ncbi:MAG: DNA/RNA non-specific endonuclease [Rikenellaceae bacterium]|jgi:endonuclease G|nr:DNA/RNA non-specific endonuclease [Rikenellaceae bacterium]